MNIAKVSFPLTTKVRKVSTNNIGHVSNPIKADSFSFKGVQSPFLDEEEGKIASEKLKKSTSGYREIYGKNFNDRFVYTMTNAYADYMKEHGYDTTMVGGDTRMATKESIPQIIKTLQDRAINVYIPKFTNKEGIAPAATPALAVSVKEHHIPIAILMTASHNPWEYGGYNFLTEEGAVADDKVVTPLAENLAKVSREHRIDKDSFNEGIAGEFDPYAIYSDYIDRKNLIDFNKIKEAGIDIYYDGLEGCGGYYFPRLMEDHNIKLAKVLNSHVKGPEPSNANLTNLKDELKTSTSNLKVGLANDGDSDRFGVVDENGNFVSANDVLTLVSYHMIKNLGMTKGTIIRSCATSRQLDYLADYFNKLDPEKYDIHLEETPVGFKYLGGKMIELEGTKDEVIVAGEESGGLTIRNHIPEKDGFVAISKILELMACEKKPIGVILKEIKEKIGNFNAVSLKFKFDGDDKKAQASKYFEKYLTGDVKEIAGYKIDIAKTKEARKHIETYKPSGDGTKIILENGTSALVRESGTEPILKLVVDSDDSQVANDVQMAITQEIESMGGIQA